MKYDFDAIVSRRNSGSAKWNAVEKEMGLEGKDIIPMSVADMEFKVAPEIVEALRDKVDFGIYGYTEATENYYEAVKGWMKKRHNWNIKKEWISLSAGVVPALFTAIRAFTHPGDKVIIQSPVYYPFAMSIVKNGCEIVNNPLQLKDGRYAMDFDDLEKKIKDPRVKLLVLCSPHNPIGRVWTQEELQRLGEICLENGVLIISDEIHSDFVYKPHTHTVFASISDEFQNNSLILTAPSKTFNLAGLQCSNIIIPNPKLKAQFDVALESTGNVFLNYFAYTACEAAYTKCESWLDELLIYIEENIKYLKTFMKENLPQIKVLESEGTYLVWLDFRLLGLNDKELEKFTKEKARVFFDEGYIFGEGGSGFERINVACPKAVLEKALINLKNAVEVIY